MTLLMKEPRGEHQNWEDWSDQLCVQRCFPKSYYPSKRLTCNSKTSYHINGDPETVVTTETVMQKQLWLWTSKSFKSDFVYFSFICWKEMILMLRRFLKQQKALFCFIITSILFGGCDISTAPCPSLLCERVWTWFWIVLDSTCSFHATCIL